MLLETDIRVDVAVPESQSQITTIIEHAPDSNVAKDYKKLTEEILEKINNK